jgi:RimJ/RimL family protein N-acetyltransferase
MPFSGRTTPLYVHVETDRTLVRTLTVEDASQRWCEWTKDPVASLMLNARPKALELDELRAYIAGFDRIDRYIVGLFDKKNGKHFGIIVSEFMEPRKLTPSLLIGEPEYRNTGVMTDLRDVVLDFALENQDFDAVVSTVLAHNTVMIEMLERRGAKPVRRILNAKRRRDGNGFYDLLVYETSREEMIRQLAEERSKEAANAASA